MPGISGQALLDQLTAVLPNAAVILCSGHPASALVRLGIDIQGAQFLQKPCRPLELQQRLSEMLAAR
jgi:FixJ family two-component response regulator